MTTAATEPRISTGTKQVLIDQLMTTMTAIKTTTDDFTSTVRSMASAERLHDDDATLMTNLAQSKTDEHLALLLALRASIQDAK